MKTVRGRSYWFPFPQDGAASASMMTEGCEAQTGFRLVHSGELQIYRNRDGFATPPAFRNGNLGFRIAHDKEE